MLGEEFGTDDDFGLREFVAGGEEVEKVQEIKDVKESEGSATHVRRRTHRGREERI